MTISLTELLHDLVHATSQTFEERFSSAVAKCPITNASPDKTLRAKFS
jgi:hypothetical protein